MDDIESGKEEIHLPCVLIMMLMLRAVRIYFNPIICDPKVECKS